MIIVYVNSSIKKLLKKKNNRLKKGIKFNKNKFGHDSIIINAKNSPHLSLIRNQIAYLNF